ncbi:MAG: hypothetical protein KDK70_16415 [Myxococcales bacterium]|nr:hypothetical protein [Myxococcales bacterium]
MNARRWARILLYVSSCIAAVFGAWYLLASDVPAYYKAFLGPSLSANPRVLGLLLGFMKVMGGCFLALGGGLVYFATTLLDEHPGRAFWMVSINLGLSLVPLQYVTLAVGSQIEYRTPWWAVSVLLVLMLSTLVLLRRARHGESSGPER